MVGSVISLYIPDVTDCRVLEIRDISQYGLGVSSSDLDLKIKIPGSSEEFHPTFKIKGSNQYTSFNFGLTGLNGELLDLPDGIYDITYTVDGCVYNTKVLRDCVIRCNVLGELSNFMGESCQQAFDCFGRDITPERIQSLKDLILQLDCAKVDAKRLKLAEAEEKLTKVNSELNSI